MSKGPSIAIPDGLKTVAIASDCPDRGPNDDDDDERINAIAAQAAI